MIAIRHRRTGEVQLVTSSEGYGADWEVAARPPRGDAGALARLRLQDGHWHEDAEAVEVAVIAVVKARAAGLAETMVTAGPAKAVAYAAKRAEVTDWAGCTDDARAVHERFPYAFADARAHGDAPAAAIGRFSAGISSADARLAAIEAAEQAGVAAIRRARTSAAKRHAAAAIDWSVGE